MPFTVDFTENRIKGVEREEEGEDLRHSDSETLFMIIVKS